MRTISWRSPEILGELFLLGLILVLASVYLSELSGLKEPARWLPLITIGVGAPLWIIRLVTVLGRRKTVEQGMIMDLGFRVGTDPQAERHRAIFFVVAIASLFIGIWLIGFHIWLPFWVVGYLAIYARVHLAVLVVVVVGFEAFILGITDYILDVVWFEPLLWRLAGVDYLFNTWPISTTF
jgi:hypothetical protein